MESALQKVVLVKSSSKVGRSRAFDPAIGVSDDASGLHLQLGVSKNTAAIGLNQSDFPEFEVCGEPLGKSFTFWGVLQNHLGVILPSCVPGWSRRPPVM